MSLDLSTQATMGRLGSMKPRDNFPTPLVNSYRAGDDRWFYLIGVEAARHFPGLCHAIDRPDLIEDERFASAASGIARNRVGPHRHPGRVPSPPSRPGPLVRRSSSEHDVWWAPCQTAAEVVADPQAAALGSFIETIDGDAGD